jgi:hypothetical protein
MNNKIDSILKLADKFMKAAQTMVEDPKAVVVDAFFGRNEENNFLQFILQADSNFSKALPDSIKTLNIGASVNAATKSANFIVNTKNPKLDVLLINALREDYKRKYGSYPEVRFADRLSKNDIKPPTVNQSHPAIMVIS